MKQLKELGIKKEDLLKQKVKTIYGLILDKMNYHNFNLRWKMLHLKIFPNYLISFNYKVHYNLLPVRSKFQNYALDNDSRCTFCNFGFETIIHIFGKCTKLTILWDYLNEVMAIMNIDYNFSAKRMLQYEFEIMNIRHTSRNASHKIEYIIIIYLTCIINYHLWKTRNEIVHHAKVFDYQTVVNKLIRSVAARNKKCKK